MCKKILLVGFKKVVILNFCFVKSEALLLFLAKGQIFL